MKHLEAFCSVLLLNRLCWSQDAAQKGVQTACWWRLSTCQLSLKVALRGRFCVTVSACVLFFFFPDEVKVQNFPSRLCWCFVFLSRWQRSITSPSVRPPINLWLVFWSLLSNGCVSERRVTASPATSPTCYTGSVISPARSWKFLRRSIAVQHNVQWRICSLHLQDPLMAPRNIVIMTLIFKLCLNCILFRFAFGWLLGDCLASTAWTHRFQNATLNVSCFYSVCVQMDLEPEGKVYICISLTGSFVDGKAANIRACS